MFTRLPKRRPQTRPGGVAETPYGDVSQVLASVIRQAERYARRWQWGMAGMGGLVLILGMCLAYTATRATLIPYVIEVDTLGTVRKVGEGDVAYVPRDEAIAKQVKDFIKAVRGLATDGKVMHDRWDDAYAMVTPRGAQQLDAYARERAFDKDLGRKAITVEISRTLKASDTSLDVSWSETTVDQSGGNPQQVFLSGLFTIVLKQPATEAELRANPLGIWLDAWSWSP